ncbi:hypothetical protein ACE8C3_21680 [Xanthomonas euvesicatoria pv. euvesicatoria]|uniref:hypothetical protein n=1 Tax=Xanthomonas euvesicatoria TaxID=456327 RepID=UPI00062D856B|nr:hypothetical protein [Xanthomonas euvesicatoria]KLA49997.1 hypothetical protein XEUV685_21945 [Xanthomonas euvesicatoria]KLA55003.1 hypothetical protein XEUV683_05810 [Xanthomonas euvesicatoria]KLA62842.1 hypothetical protein XEUV695_21705 [Xanthomonas euvesicatoria]KLA63762.1 hypothetical protein XEUV689_19505 [Xanthomonas euvesicatoria]KLA72350.1 hypothetical protein XEUVF42_14415 [Xanthomonas euvesicatoria]
MALGATWIAGCCADFETAGPYPWLMARSLPAFCWWLESATNAHMHFHHCPLAEVRLLDAGGVGGQHAHVSIVTAGGIVTGPAANLAQGMRFVERFYSANGLPCSTRELKRGRIKSPWLANFFAQRRRASLGLQASPRYEKGHHVGALPYH